jgi:putative outer membrane protein
MKNFVLKSVMVLSLASSFALAEGGFVGVEGGYDFSSKLGSDGENIKDNRPNIGIKGGFDFDVARVYGGYFYHAKAKDSDTFENADYNAKWTTHKFVVGGDYTPTIANNFKLVAGLYTGVSVINFKFNANSDEGRFVYDTTKSGWLLGAKLGAEYSFDNNNALEFGVKADKSWYKVDELDKVKATDISAYLGYTYKF